MVGAVPHRVIICSFEILMCLGILLTSFSVLFFIIHSAPIITEIIVILGFYIFVIIICLFAVFWLLLACLELIVHRATSHRLSYCAKNDLTVKSNDFKQYATFFYAVPNATICKFCTFDNAYSLDFLL